MVAGLSVAREIGVKALHITGQLGGTDHSNDIDRTTSDGLARARAVSSRG